jgi:heme exporter protein A
MERVTLADRAGDLVGTFSSGMKQRARFAVALAAESELLLLDEPSSNLDAAGVELVKQIIDSEVGAGRSVVLATNSQEEREWCERSLRIEDYLRR